MEANKEAAADALARARQKYAAADDAGALQWAEKSLKLYRTTEAAKLQQEIREFGDGSENAALVRRVLASRDHFEALSALPGAVRAEVQHRLGCPNARYRGAQLPSDSEATDD